MSRIRSIKPEFFTHEDLFEAEYQSGLPLRLAFAGLWTQCDREGRFVWRPRQLKVAIMPYDELDFSRVLDALVTRDFVVKYTSGNRAFGVIPSWHRHQVINNREKASDLPIPTENTEQSDASSTRAPRVDDACSGEGKGRERKGKEESLSETSSDEPVRSTKAKAYSEDYEAFWIEYPRTPNMSKSKAYAGWNKLSPEEREQCAKAVKPYKAFLASKPEHPTMHATTFINERRFDGFAVDAVRAAQPVTVDDWIKRLAYGRREMKWLTVQWGPAPGQPGCRVPENLIEPNDGAGWREREIAA